MKYFYTDPLAAAWMAKHFDMGFEDYVSARHIAKEYAGTDDTPEKYYIHSESLHLLKPKRWDAMTDAGKNSIGYVMSFYDGITVIQSSTENPEQILTRAEIHPAGLGNWKIIQRGGIAFHWPESES